VRTKNKQAVLAEG